MNVKVNKKWNCQTCKKDIIINTKSVQIKSNFHEHGKEYAFFVEKCEFNNPETAKTYNTFTDVIENCKNVKGIF